MPTFYYPAAFATEAARNLRLLADDGELETRGPGTAAVLGDLRDAAAAMRQVIDRIATANALPGHPAAARAAGLQIGDELHQAGTALEASTTRLAGAVTAFEEAASAPTEGPEWVQVVSLSGQDATEALDLLEEEGPHMTAVFLSGWDFGTETDDQAVEQHATREHLPLIAGEQAMTVDAYTIIANPGREQIAMYRALDGGPGPDILDAQDELAALLSATRAEKTPPENAHAPEAPGLEVSEPPTRRSQRAARQSRPVQQERSWFDLPAAGAGAGQGRELGL